MVPVPTDSTDLENLDSEVAEHQDRNDSDVQPGKQVSDSCSTKQHDSVINRPPHNTANETVPRNSESTTQQQISSSRRFPGRNRSSFYGEKRRDRHWREEHCGHRVYNRCRKQPSDTSAKDPAPIAGTSDEVINTDDGIAAVSEPLMEMVNHHSSADYSSDLAKPAMPSGLKQNIGANRSSNYYARSRNRFYDAYSRYGDDYDSDPRRCKDRTRNRRPMSAKATAGAVCDDDDDFDEESNDSDRDHAASSSAVSAESKNAVESGNKQNNPRLGDAPRRRRNNGYHSYQNATARPTSAPKAGSTLPTDLEQRQSTGNDPEVKPRPQNHRPRKCWNRRVSDKVGGSAVGNDEEVEKTTDAASRVSVEVGRCDDVQREGDAVGVMKDESSTSAERKLVTQADALQTSTDGGGQGVSSHTRRNNHTRRGAGGSGRFDKESASCDNRQHGQDRADGSSSYAQKETYQRNRGDRSSASRNFRPETRPSNNHAGGSGQSASRDDRQHGQDRADGSSSYAKRETYQRNRGGRSGASRNFNREIRPSDKHRHCDNQSVHVDSQTEVPSAKRRENELNSRPRPPRFCVQTQPTSATAQLPTS